MPFERDTQFVMCEAAGHRCALPVSSVEETMRPLPVESVEGAPGFVVGVALVRGEPTPVVDLRVLLGGAGEREPARRWVTLRGRGRRVALAVDAVDRVETLTGERATALPSLLEGAANAYVDAIGERNRELYVVLRAARLLDDDALQAVVVQP